MSEPVEDHPGIKSISRWLDPNPNLPAPLRHVSELCANLRDHILADAEVPSAELTAGLRKLVEAKDCFVRAKLFDQEVRELIDARDSSSEASRDETPGRGNGQGE